MFGPKIEIFSFCELKKLKSNLEPILLTKFCPRRDKILSSIPRRCVSSIEIMKNTIIRIEVTHQVGIYDIVSPFSRQIFL